MIKRRSRMMAKCSFMAMCISLLLSACVDTGLKEISLSVSARGTRVSEPIEGQNGTRITLSRADLAFGPLYLCAGVNAGDLCDTARFEWLDSAVINLIDDQAMNLGLLQGSTGVVQSWMYDLGISSQLTQREAFVLKAARELNGHSLLIEGEAQINNDAVIPFRAALKIEQSEDTERGIPVIRKSGSENFYREVKNDSSSLQITFDPQDWLKDLDLSVYVTHDHCESISDSILCDGNLERHCNEAEEIESRDCAELGQICLPTLGCQEQLKIEEGSTAYRVLRNALLVGERPQFQWLD